MPLMAKPKKKPTRSDRPLGVNVSPALLAALTDYIENAKPRPTKTAIIEMLLEGFLSEKGYWPPEHSTEAT